jgi:hypothetical protein
MEENETDLFPDPCTHARRIVELIRRSAEKMNIAGQLVIEYLTEKRPGFAGGFFFSAGAMGKRLEERDTQWMEYATIEVCGGRSSQRVDC